MNMPQEEHRFYQEKIHTVLEQLRIHNNEVMFMWKYMQDEVCGSIFKNNEFYPRL